MPRTFTLVSVVVHAVVIAGVIVWQLASDAPLPILRNALAYDEPFVKMADIPLPPPAPRAPAPATPPLNNAAAPIEAPSAITPETGHERDVVVPMAPGVDGGTVDGTGSISAIPGISAAPPPPPPPPLPAEPVRLHSGIKPPQKLVDVKPTYPPLAQSARQQGIVILETVIDVTGAVETVRVLRGYPLLDQAAIDAVKQWRFTPALLNGRPVPVVMTVTVDFTLR